MLYFIEVKKIKKYISKLASKKEEIYQHFMKMYLYQDFKESQGIYDDDWTKNHWTRELLDFFEPREENKIKALFDRLPRPFSLSFMNALDPREIDWEKNIAKFKIKENPGRHDLPGFSEEKLNSERNRISKCYTVFVHSIINRLEYSTSLFNMDGFGKLLNVIFKNRFSKCEEIKEEAEKVNFSDRYEFLQTYFFTAEGI